MTYSPSLDDIHEVEKQQGYKPSLDDVNEIENQSDSIGRQLLALGAGALKGFGEVGYGLNHLMTRGVNALLPQSMQLSYPDNPFDYINPTDSVTKYLGGLEQQYPTTSKIGQFTGELAPTLVLPEVGAVQRGTSLVSRPAAEFLEKNLAGKAIANVGNAAIGAGALAPIYNPDVPLSQSIPQGMKSGAEFGLLAPAFALAGNVGTRGWEALTQSAAKVQKQESKAYQAIQDEAATNNFKANMNDYRSTLHSMLSELSQAPRESVTEDLESRLYDRLDAVDKDIAERPGAFDVKGTKLLIRGINDDIEKAQRAGDFTAVAYYQMLKNAAKNDLIRSLQEQSMPHLADKYLKTDKNYAQLVVPLRENPTSIPGLVTQATAIGLASKLPEAWALPALTTLGMHGANSPVAGLIGRLFGDYRGGLTKDLMIARYPLLFNLLNRISLPLAAQGQSPRSLLSGEVQSP